MNREKHPEVDQRAPLRGVSWRKRTMEKVHGVIGGWGSFGICHSHARCVTGRVEAITCRSCLRRIGNRMGDLGPTAVTPRGMTHRRRPQWTAP